jgi:hypothetical protein
MKKICLFCVCVLFISGTLPGCVNNLTNSDTIENIAFEYFYRGFTPLTEEADIGVFESLSGVEIIQTEEDWHNFMDTYCPGIMYFIDVDYSKECLIAVSNVYGAKPSHNVSNEIKTITVRDNHIEIMIDNEQNPSERICALNLGVGHWYVNIIKVNKSDLPSDIEGVYKKQ